MNELFNNIKKEIEHKYKTASASHDLDHTLRVYKMCMYIGEIEGADLNILKLSAYLHDIARDIQDKSCGEICHAELGAEMARELLKECNADDDIINKVTHCIESHRFRANKPPQTLEAKILYDADKLDSIGAIGIGRAFVFAGENGARVHNSEVDLSLTESYGKEDTAWREYMVKLRFIKDKLLTTEGKRIAEGRHKFMTEFFLRLNSEVEGLI